MEKLGINGEINSFGINKLINEILNSNGHYEENMSGADLSNSKFSILIEPKKDYGIAYLKLKFRERNLDFEDLEIKQDFSKLQHDGLSKVIINFKLKPYQKRQVNIHHLLDDEKKQYALENSDKMPKTIVHPYSKLLTELEKQKNEAQAIGDDVGVNYYQSNIKEIIKKHPYEISIEQWDSLDTEQKKKFILIKMKEAKILDDIDSFNYWKANLAYQNELKDTDDLRR